MTAPVTHELRERLASIAALDQPAQAAGEQVRSLLGPGAVKDALSGTWLGHALHPVLTDTVIGTWLSASILDLIGGRAGQQAADRLIGVGLLAAVPTAASGSTDWADAEPASDEVRRLGALHALANTTAIGLYAASLGARRRGRRGRGALLGFAGLSVLGASGWIGGNLSLANGVGVDQTAFLTLPAEWTPAFDASQLVDGRPAHATVAGVELLLLLRGGEVLAMADRCSHRGGALHEGELVDGCIQCPLHGSRFSVRDGSLQRGPSAYPQPVYEARVHEGRVEVRAPAG